MCPFSSSICTNPILLNKPVQPILTAALQLLQFSSFSPVVSQSINTIDWMVNLTRLNQLQMKRGKEERSQTASQRVEALWKKQKKQIYHLKLCLFLHPFVCWSLICCLSIYVFVCLSHSCLYLFSLSVRLSLSFFLSFCLTGCTWDRNCTLKTSFSDWPGDRE